MTTKQLPFRLALALTSLLFPAAFAHAQDTGAPASTSSTPPADTPASQSSSSPAPQQDQPAPNQTIPNTNTGRREADARLRAAGARKIALAPTANYQNRYEVFGGVNFENFQAGQNLPKRMNFAGAEAQGTMWLTPHLGATADYRFEGGTTPVFPNNRFNRVAIFQQNFLGGITWRGPKGRYAAVDYHALAGGSYGIFDHAFQGTSALPGSAPITPTQVGLYTNRLAPMAALGASLDFNYTRSIAVRIAPDLILEHYGDELREFVYVSGGIVYRFGHRR